MADQNDDRISQFIDRDGVQGDQDYMIGILNELKSKIQEVNSVKVNVIATGSVAQLTREINTLMTALESVTTVQERMRQASLADAEARMKNAEAIRKEKEALIQRYEAEKKTNTTRTTSAGKTAAQKELDNYGLLEKQIKDLDRQIKNLKLEPEVNTDELDRLETQLKELKFLKDAIDGKKSPEQRKQTSAPAATQQDSSGDSGGLNDEEIDANIERIKELKKELDDAKLKAAGLFDFGAPQEELKEAQDNVLQLQLRYDSAVNSVGELIKQQRAYAQSLQDGESGGEEKRKARIQELKQLLIQLGVQAEQTENDLNALEQNPNRNNDIYEATKRALSEYRVTIRAAIGELASLDEQERKNIETEKEFQRVSAQSKKKIEIVDTGASAKNQVASDIRAIQQELSNLQPAAQRARQALSDIRKAEGTDSGTYKRKLKEVAELEARLQVLQKRYASLDEQEKQRQQNVGLQEKIIADLEREEAAAAKSESAYERLKNTIKELREEATQLGAREILGEQLTDEEVKRYAQLTSEINKYDAALGRMEVQVGSAKRNSDAYARQLFSLQQIFRELPSFAYGTATGISALSNNIPIFVDDIQRIITKNRELKKSGEEVPSAFSAILRSVFSVQTAIAGIVTVVTIFNKEISEMVSQLFSGGKSMSQIKKEAAAAEKQFEDTTREVQRLNAEVAFFQKKGQSKTAILNTDVSDITQMREELQQLNKDIDGTSKIIKDGFGTIIGQDNIPGLVANVDAANKELEQKSERHKVVFKDLMESIKDEGTAVGDHFREVFGDGKLSDQMMNAFQNNTLEAVLDKTSEKTKFLYDQFKNISKQVFDADMAQSEALRAQRLKELEVEQKKSDIIKEQGRIARAIALENARTRTEIIQINAQDVLNDDTTTEQQRLDAVRRISQARIEIARAEKLAVDTDPSANDDEKYEALQNLIREQKAAITEAERERINIQYDFFVRRKTAQQKQFDVEMSLEIDKNDRLTAQLVQSLDVRLKAEQKAAKDRIAIRESELNLELQKAGLNEAEIKQFKETGEVIRRGKRLELEELKALRVAYEADIVGITAVSAEKQFEILKEELQRQRELYSQHQQELEVILQKGTVVSNRGFFEETKALKEMFAQRKISVQDYVREQTRITDRFNNEQIENARENLDEQLKMFGDAEAKKVAAQQNFDKAKKNLSDLTVSGADEKTLLEAGRQVEVAEEQYKAALEFYSQYLSVLEKINGLNVDEEQTASRKQIDALQARLDKWNEIYDAMGRVADLGFEIANASFSGRQDELDEESRKLDEMNERERQHIEQTVKNEEEKEKKLGELRNREQQQREIIEKKQRRIEYDRAKAEKVATVARILIDTAQKITALKFQALLALASFPPNPVAAATALAGIPGVLGASALGIATVAAVPLPKLATGTKDWQGGPVIMGDAGKSELVVEPSGKMWVTADKDTVYDLPEHSIVYPDAELALREQLADAEMGTHETVKIYGTPSQINVNIPEMSKMEKTMESGFNRVVSQLKRMPVHVPTNGTNKDLLMRYGINYYKYL